MEDERLRVGSGQVGPAPREQVGVQRGRPRHDRRHRARRRADHRREQVVVQVLADAGEVDGDLEPDPRQRGGRPDAGEHQQLRRLDRACAEHDLLLGAHLSPADVDPDTPTALEDEPADARSGQHGQVRRVQHRPQERDRLALANVVLDRQVAVADAVLGRAVVVVVERDPDLLRRLDRSRMERVRLVVGGHTQRPACAVVLGLAATEVLGAPEQRQHVLVAPALAPVGRPGVVVAPVAADVDHPVQAARSAEHLPARDVELRGRCSPAAGPSCTPSRRGSPRAPRAARDRGSPGSRRPHRPRSRRRWRRRRPGGGRRRRRRSPSRSRSRRTTRPPVDPTRASSSNADDQLVGRGEERRVVGVDLDHALARVLARSSGAGAAARSTGRASSARTSAGSTRAPRRRGRPVSRTAPPPADGAASSPAPPAPACSGCRSRPSRHRRAASPPAGRPRRRGSP